MSFSNMGFNHGLSGGAGGGGGSGGATSLITTSTDGTIVQNVPSSYNAGTQTLTINISATGGSNSIKTKTSAYTILVTDNIVYVDCTSAPVIITLLAVANFSTNNKIYTFIKIDSSTNNMTLQAQGSDQIQNGTANQAIISNTQNKTFNLLADKVNNYWRSL